MRKKLTSKTYLRDVDKYIVKFDLSNDDYYIIIKKILSCKPFILESGLKLMDNNLYVRINTKIRKLYNESFF